MIQPTERKEIEPVGKGDDADRAACASEIALDLAVNAIRNAPEEVAPRGECIWCNEKLTKPAQKFCDPECGHAWHDQRNRELAFGGRL